MQHRIAADDPKNPDYVTFQNGVWVIREPSSGFCHGPFATRKIAVGALNAGRQPAKSKGVRK